MRKEGPKFTVFYKLHTFAIHFNGKPLKWIRPPSSQPPNLIKRDFWLHWYPQRFSRCGANMLKIFPRLWVRDYRSSSSRFGFLSPHHILAYKSLGGCILYGRAAVHHNGVVWPLSRFSALGRKGGVRAHNGCHNLDGLYLCLKWRPRNYLQLQNVSKYSNPLASQTRQSTAKSSRSGLCTNKQSAIIQPS